MEPDVNETQSTRGTDADRDPVSSAHGIHPVGTGVGGALAGAAGAAATGTGAGPVGPVVGIAVGTRVGGLAGKGVAESITREDSARRPNYKTRLAVSGGSFDNFGAAQAFAVNSHGKHSGRRFDEVEAELSVYWSIARGKSGLTRHTTRQATRDASDRLSH
jgi:hypothetical protein